MRPRRTVDVADDYTWSDRGGLTVKKVGPAIAELPSMSESAPMIASTIPANFVLVQDPILSDERALIGSVIAGTMEADAALAMVTNRSHKWILDTLAGVMLGADRMGDAIRACRAAGLPPELTGAETPRGAVGYLASCRSHAADEAEIIAIMGRLRSVRPVETSR